MMQIDAIGAQLAIARYNRPAVIELDREAARYFADGLGSSLDELTGQIHFVLYKYGGLGGPPTHGLVEEIATQVIEHRTEWTQLIDGARSFAFGMQRWDYSVPSAVHFDCFGSLRKLGSAAQIRCMTKFLHLIRPHAFIVQDRWIGRALDIDVSHNSDSGVYRAFADRFQEFVRLHEHVISAVRATERPQSWSDIKLVDKILLCRRAAALKQAA